MMGAAKKVVQLERKAAKVELTEVKKDTKKSAKVTRFKEYEDLARSLTREKSLTHDEVEALLESQAGPDQAGPVQADSAAPAAKGPEPSAEAAPMPETPRRDMRKIALFASLVAVILLLGFYFNLNQNIKHLTTQVQDLASIKTSVATLDTKVGTMESKVADLETLPAKTRAALMSSILDEMSQKTSYMSSQLPSPEQQDKLMKAKELIQQVQTELNAQN
jgi:outer membrane murein-binding lipoprotein Lpp